MRKFFLIALGLVFAGQMVYLLIHFIPRSPQDDFLVFQTPNTIQVIEVGKSIRWVKAEHPDSTVSLTLSDGSTATQLLSLGREIDGQHVTWVAGPNFLDLTIPLRTIDFTHQLGGRQSFSWPIHPNHSSWIFSPGLRENPLNEPHPLQTLNAPTAIAILGASPSRGLVFARAVLPPDMEAHYHLLYSTQESTLYSFLDSAPQTWPVALGSTYDSYDSWRAASGMPTLMPGRVNFADYFFPNVTRALYQDPAPPHAAYWVYSVPPGLSEIKPSAPLLNLDKP